MKYATTLTLDNLTDKFINNYINNSLVRCPVTVSNSITAQGRAMWGGPYRAAAKNYIRNYVRLEKVLPTDVHRIVSIKFGNSWANIVKFPNMPPSFVIKGGRAEFTGEYLSECDAVAPVNSGVYLSSVPTKYRSELYLRSELDWKVPHYYLGYLHSFQQHTKISDKALIYFVRLAKSFIDVHGFPPNLCILRNLLLDLSSVEKLRCEAKALLKVINRLDKESRKKRVFQSVDYIWKPLNHKSFRQDDGYTSNVREIPDEAKYKEIFKIAYAKRNPDVYAVEYEHVIGEGDYMQKKNLWAGIADKKAEEK